jgi:hypothetical protein
MRKNLILVTFFSLLTFSGCQSSTPIPPVTNIANNEKGLMNFTYELNAIKSNNVNNEIGNILVKGLNATTAQCNETKKDKHILFDIYYLYRCKITHSYENGFLKRTLKTMQKTIKKTIGAGTNSYFMKPSFLTLYAPMTITKQENGYKVVVDGVSKIESKTPGDVNHFWSLKKFTDRFNDELYTPIKK